MGFLDIIERLQQKPRATRMRILFASVGGMMILITGIWLGTVRATLNPPLASADNTVRPLALLRDTLMDGWNIARNEFKSFSF